MAPGVGVAVHAVDRERLGLVPKRVLRGDPHPHLPVLAAQEPAVEAAEVLVHRAADDDRRRHDALLAREAHEGVA